VLMPQSGHTRPSDNRGPAGSMCLVRDWLVLSPATPFGLIPLASRRPSQLISTSIVLLTGIVRDERDDMMIACAVDGGDTIVTRDKFLLALASYQSIAIITPEGFRSLRAGT
jgi:hypothetical protein